MKKQIPSINLVVLLHLLLIAALTGHCMARTTGNKWTKWPAGREDYEPSCELPQGFAPIGSLVPSAKGMSLNQRFRSSDGSVVFGVATMHSVRDLAPTLEARAIRLPLLEGERVVKREPLWRNVNFHNSRFKHYEVAITVEGPKNAYTRYFRIELSTGSLPNAFSILWEFKVADEKTRRDFQEIYRNFKKRVNLGED